MARKGEPVSPQELAQIVRHLERQGFRVEVMTTEPFSLLVTLPFPGSRLASHARTLAKNFPGFPSRVVKMERELCGKLLRRYLDQPERPCARPSGHSGNHMSQEALRTLQANQRAWRAANNPQYNLDYNQRNRLAKRQHDREYNQSAAGIVRTMRANAKIRGSQ